MKEVSEMSGFKIFIFILLLYPNTQFEMCCQTQERHLLAMKSIPYFGWNILGLISLLGHPVDTRPSCHLLKHHQFLLTCSLINNFQSITFTHLQGSTCHLQWSCSYSSHMDISHSALGLGINSIQLQLIK